MTYKLIFELPPDLTLAQVAEALKAVPGKCLRWVPSE